MACFSPLEAWRLSSGAVFFGAQKPDSVRLTLPCGQCVGCRLERSRQWAVRCMHESSLHDRNCFVTLTYNNDNLVSSLNYRDFQLFMKRLRKRFASTNVRFFMCGEYGERFQRPHFHALLFGVDFFSDRTIWRESSSGFQLFRSQQLENLWKLGHCEIGEVTFESAAYVARYCMKKVTGDAAESYYSRVDVRTGEVVKVEPEFAHMSLKPGIGFDWIRLYRTDVYRGDSDPYVVVNGVKCQPPRYYDRYMEDTFEFEDIRAGREIDGWNRRADNTAERLAVREKVTIARLRFKQRSLE